MAQVIKSDNCFLRNVVFSLGTLARLSQLSREFPRSLEERNVAIDLVRSRWVAIRESERAQKIDLRTKLVEDHVETLYLVNIWKVYRRSFARVETPEEVDFQAARIIADLDAVIVPPAVKSERGNNGPTLIATFPLRDPFTGETDTQRFVLKRTDWNELFMNQFFSLCSSLEFPSGGSIGFCAPNIAGFDLEKGIYFEPNGKYRQIDQEEVAQLKGQADLLLKLYAHGAKEAPSIWLRAETVMGPNLYDFLTGTYSDLSTKNKKSLLKRMARIAYLDFWVGNTDRFIRPDFDHTEGGHYLMDALEGNLGNMLVDFRDTGSKPTPFVIDNGIEPPLIHDPAQRVQYLLFLKQLCEKVDFIPDLVAAMTTSIKLDLVVQFSEHGAEKNDFENFTTDLANEEYQEQMRNGMVEMEKIMHEYLIPAWEGAHFASLRQQMKQHLPDLETSLDERFQLFKKIRAS